MGSVLRWFYPGAIELTTVSLSVIAASGRAILPKYLSRVSLAIFAAE